MFTRQARLIDHLASEMQTCDATAERLSAKASFSEDDAKSRFSSDLVDAVREHRSRVQHKLAAMRSLFRLTWQGETVASASHERPWNSQTTTGTLT